MRVGEAVTTKLTELNTHTHFKKIRESKRGDVQLEHESPLPMPTLKMFISHTLLPKQHPSPENKYDSNSKRRKRKDQRERKKTVSSSKRKKTYIK